MKVRQDEDRRVIYEPGDVVGVANYSFLGKLARFLFTPRTALYHFLLIDAYLAGEDDYSIIESVAKGPTMGRLSWYRGRDYQVFRVNDEHAKFWFVFNNHKLRLNASRSFDQLGQIVVEKASRFGRHGYDFTLYLKLLVGVLQFQAGRLVHGKAPRRMGPADIPYARDQAFICTELVFEAWRAVGIQLRAPGHAPLPCEYVLAETRGELVRIDFHNGTKGQAWRERVRDIRAVPGRVDEILKDLDKRPTTVVNIPRETLEAGKPNRDIIGRQAGQKRNRVHVYRQPYGYPIRLCDWIMVEKTDIEEVGQCQGVAGPADDIQVLAAALDWRENAGDRICRHCRAVAVGKRTPIGMSNHGHGKGADIER